MNRLSELAVAKRSVTLLLAAALFIAGVSAWGSLKQELLPDIEFPVITVIAPFPGAGSEDVAEQVAEPIERAISGVPRLETVQSTSANSIALVIAQFSYGTDVKEALAAIEDGIADAGLPDTVEPSVSALNINASPVIIASIAATSEDGLEAAAEIARTEIVPEIAAIEGVARADVTGGLETRLLITLDPGGLAAKGVSVAQITGVLTANNLTFPSGQLSDDGTKIPVSTIGSHVGRAGRVARRRLRDSRAVDPAAPERRRPAAPAAPAPITIGDLGTVELVDVATTGYGRTDGQPSLSLSVTKTSDANTVLVAEAVQAKLDEIAARHPGALTITTVSDLSDFIKESTDGLLREGGLGALFAILTIFLFLFSLRSTLVAAISIPLSDPDRPGGHAARRHQPEHHDPGWPGGRRGTRRRRRHRRAREHLSPSGPGRGPADRRDLDGPREVASAITASTLTTVAVFLPLGFVGGLVSQFFLPFALTVTFALLASLICALTVVPGARLLPHRSGQAQGRCQSGEPKQLALGPRSTRRPSRFVLRSRWTQARHGRPGRRPVRRVAGPRPAAADPVHQRRLGEDPAGQRRAADRGDVRGRPRAGHRGRRHRLAADPDVELVQTSIPGEGDTSFQTIIAAQSGRPANSATLTVRLEHDGRPGRRRPTRSRTPLAPVKTDGYDVQVSEAAGFTSNGLNIIVSAADRGLVESATEAVVAALADDPDLANLPERPRQGHRRRSRSSSTRTRPSPSA